jgi:hypothetical protein
MFMPPRMVHLLSEGAGQVLALFLCSLKIAPLTGVSTALALFYGGKGAGALRSHFEHELGMNALLSIGSGGSH